MKPSIDTPKIFISYSWKPSTNKQRTIELAERMINDGINVIIDIWNLGEGQDKYQFMEQMVNNPAIIRVLLICNKDYKEKADQKKGGVGTESLIISDKIYKQANQKKFIPVIFEKDENGDAYLPTFIHSRIYIDLSSDEIFEDEYEKLVRNIFDKPAIRRPPLGTPPAYLLETEPIFLRTAHKVKTIHNALLNEKINYQVFIDDYYSTFIQALNDFRFEVSEIQDPPFIDELILKRIEEMKALRDDATIFFETIFTYSAQFDNDKFISFLERIIEFIHNIEGATHPSDSLGYLSLDQYRVFYYELFLYLVMILINKEKFTELGEILYNSFVVFDRTTKQAETFTFAFFNQYARSLDKYRNERLQMRSLSVTADLIKQRADNINYPFEKLLECDVLLYYIDMMKNKDDNDWSWPSWFPQTAVYYINSLPILERLVSMRHFEKIKSIFNVQTISELRQKIETLNTLKADKLPRINYRCPYIVQAFDFTKIGTVK